MSKVSTLRRAGTVARVVGRIASEQAGRSRTIRALTSAGRATARSFGIVLHQLWLEVTGFVFLSMAGLGAVAAAHEVAQYHAGRIGSGRVMVAICFTAAFAWFGFTSFWRVRKKQ